MEQEYWFWVTLSWCSYLMKLSQEPIMKMKCCKLCSCFTYKIWKAYYESNNSHVMAILLLRLIIVFLCWMRTKSIKCDKKKNYYFSLSTYSVSRNAIENNNKDLSVYVILWSSYIFLHLSSVYNYIRSSFYWLICSSLLFNNGDYWKLWWFSHIREVFVYLVIK